MKKKGLIALTLCLALACPAALAETVDMIDVLLNSKTTQAFTQEDLAFLRIDRRRDAGRVRLRLQRAHRRGG